VTALLFDQHLSPRLVGRLMDVFPGSVHVSEAGLAQALDRAVWEYARANHLVLVSKDADFGELGLLLGFPPKVVWIRRGNCTTGDIEDLLRVNRDTIEALAQGDESSVLAVF
jgi:predicted nuclease of predicted toxin-antitoxin system